MTDSNGTDDETPHPDKADLSPDVTYATPPTTNGGFPGAAGRQRTDGHTYTQADGRTGNRQDKTKQNRTSQNRTRQDETGQCRTSSQPSNQPNKHTKERTSHTPVSQDKKSTRIETKPIDRHPNGKGTQAR